jgi:hypothetical protein
MRLQLNATTGVQEYSGPVKIDNPELVQVYVALTGPERRDRFFILTKADFQRAFVKGYSQWMDKLGWKRPRKPDSYAAHLHVEDIEKFENNWQLIIQRLAQTDPDQSLPVPKHSRGIS